MRIRAGLFAAVCAMAMVALPHTVGASAPPQSGIVDETTSSTVAVPSSAADESDTVDANSVRAATPSSSTTAPTLAPPTSTTPSSAEILARQGPVADSANQPGQRGVPQQIVPIPPPPPTVPPETALPANSGSGRRIVYLKSKMRVWLVNDDNSVLRTYLVSGRLTYNQPSPGEYSVFSRSRWTCAIHNSSVCWPYMVRFTYGPGGLAIGFHEIPTNRATGRKLQTIGQLGTARSSGCVRQAPWDAAFLWDWAPVGTRVVVIQ